MGDQSFGVGCNPTLKRADTPREPLEFQRAIIVSPVTENLHSTFGDFEMWFRVKAHDTGMRDKIFNVPVDGFIAPIKESHFNGLVE